MLAREENEVLTRVGPDTPMGNTLRRYWIPALLAWELSELQDRAVQESMGRIVDRSQEHLGPADKAVIQARRLLLHAHTVRDGGTPLGIAPTYYELRAAEGVVPRDADWRKLLTPDMATHEILQTV